MRRQSAWNVPSSVPSEKLGIHRNIPDGLSLEVGEIDAPENISGSPAWFLFCSQSTEAGSASVSTRSRLTQHAR